MKGERIIIPTSCRDSILADLHKSHEGVNRSLSLARNVHYWPGMEADMMDYIRRCVTCIDNAKIPVETLHPHEVPARPWIKIGVDSSKMIQDRNFKSLQIISPSSVHLPCRIDSPPKDAEIPARPVSTKGVPPSS